MKELITAGVDEVGRGCLAGPVVSAAASIRRYEPYMDAINDSKKISAKKRIEIFNLLIDEIDYGVGVVDNTTIDNINILEATFKSMREALTQINTKAPVILVDGRMTIRGLPSVNQKAIVRGDGKSLSIAAASIIAKVTRDKIMEELHQQYPNYDFINNKGYGTKKHIELIREYGPSPVHRMSFLRGIIGNS